MVAGGGGPCESGRPLCHAAGAHGAARVRTTAILDLIKRGGGAQALRAGRRRRARRLGCASQPPTAAQPLAAASPARAAPAPQQTTQSFLLIYEISDAQQPLLPSSVYTHAPPTALALGRAASGALGRTSSSASGGAAGGAAPAPPPAAGESRALSGIQISRIAAAELPHDAAAAAVCGDARALVVGYDDGCLLALSWDGQVRREAAALLCCRLRHHPQSKLHCFVLSTISAFFHISSFDAGARHRLRCAWLAPSPGTPAVACSALPAAAPARGAGPAQPHPPAPRPPCRAPPQPTSELQDPLGDALDGSQASDAGGPAAPGAAGPRTIAALDWAPGAGALAAVLSDGSAALLRAAAVGPHPPEPDALQFSHWLCGPEAGCAGGRQAGGRAGKRAGKGRGGACGGRGAPAVAAQTGWRARLRGRARRSGRRQLAARSCCARPPCAQP
jgi:hypothetical protein